MASFDVSCTPRRREREDDGILILFSSFLYIISSAVVSRLVSHELFHSDAMCICNRRMSVEIASVLRALKKKCLYQRNAHVPNRRLRGDSSASSPMPVRNITAPFEKH